MSIVMGVNPSLSFYKLPNTRNVFPHSSSHCIAHHQSPPAMSLSLTRTTSPFFGGGGGGGGRGGGKGGRRYCNNGWRDDWDFNQQGRWLMKNDPKWVALDWLFNIFVLTSTSFLLNLAGGMFEKAREEKKGRRFGYH